MEFSTAHNGFSCDIIRLLMVDTMVDDHIKNEDISKELIHELSWDDAVRLTCAFERWAYDKRSTKLQSLRWMHHAHRMRKLVCILPYCWNPPKRPGKQSFFKFVASIEREHDEQFLGN